MIVLDINVGVGTIVVFEMGSHYHPINDFDINTDGLNFKRHFLSLRKQCVYLKLSEINNIDIILMGGKVSIYHG